MREIFAKAVACFSNGELDDAERHCRAIIDQNPNQHNSLHLLGLVRHRLGENEEAEELIRRALAIDGQNPEFLKNPAFVLCQMGQSAEAVELCRKAARIDPRDAAIYNNMGIAFEDLSKLEDAERAYGRAVRIAPEFIDALINLGTVSRQLGRHDEALEIFERALIHAPDLASVHNNIGLTQLKANRLEAAKTSVQHAIDINPNYAAAFCNMARVLEKEHNFDAAADHCRRAIKIDPDNYIAHDNLGSALQQLGRLDEAISYCERATEIDESRPEAFNNLANLVLQKGDFPAAIQLYDRAIQADPDYAQAYFSKSLAHMSKGDFDEGFKTYHWRHKAAEPGVPGKTYPQSEWDGKLFGEGKLLIHGEQGVGDQILFGGLIPSIMSRGVRCVLEVDPRLVGLFARAMPDLDVVPQLPKPENPAIDAKISKQIAIASLISAIETWPEEWAPSTRYLEPEAESVRKFEDRLSELGDHPRIGISWRSTRERTGPMKSMPLAMWDPILTARDALFVNLQYGDTKDEIAEAQPATGIRIYTDPDIDLFNDLEGLAALIDGLDLVLTTSNSTAHLAAALGKQCWLLLQASPLWYWGVTGENTLFYPSVTAFRQEKANDWPRVITKVTTTLAEPGDIRVR